MQGSTDGETTVLRPRGVASAYGTMIRRTETPRDIEHRVFAEVTAELQDAEQPQAPPAARVHAIHRNRELWIALACDVTDTNNRLPDVLRANIVSLAIWVNGESSRLLRSGGSLSDLIETNKIIMAGLAPPAPAESTQCPSS